MLAAKHAHVGLEKLYELNDLRLGHTTLNEAPEHLVGDFAIDLRADLNERVKKFA